MELPWIALALMTVIGLERTRLRRLPARFMRPHFAADLAFFLLGAIGLGVAMRAAAGRAVEALGVPPLLDWPAPAAFALTLVAYDLGAWLAHRLEHRVDWLWQAHKVHHASPRLDWLAAFRMHPVEYALRHALSPVVLLLSGFPAVHVALASILAAAWAAFVHANLHVGAPWLEGWLVTPRLHHLHHAPGTSDRNFGAIFSLWDRLAGVLTREPLPRDAVLGVPGELGTHPHGFWEQLGAPFTGRAGALSSRPAPAP